MARSVTGARVGKGRRRRIEEDDSNRWLGTYGDAVTLLMAFFIMLYAMSQIDQVKFEAFVSGLRVPFGNESADILDGAPAIVGEAGAETPAVDPGAVVDHGPEPVWDPEETALPEIDPADPEPETDPFDLDSIGEIDLAQLEEVRAEIALSLDAAGLDDIADMDIDHRGLVISISADEVLFETGSTEISQLGREVIGVIALPLSTTRNELVIEGHTDDVPLNRAGYTNWNLSTDRAVAVVGTLHADAGIDQRRLGAAGFGEFRPRVPNDTDAQRSRNRRVDILISPETTE